jgi:LEA14-like dessication related protein
MMKFNRRRAVALAFVAVSVLTAPSCATLARQAFANPIVEVRDVRVRTIGLAGGTLDVILDVQNPNEYRIDASKITYAFFVDTTQVVTGVIERLVTLEEKGRTEITVPVTFGYAEMGIAMRQYLAKGALDYTVRGEFTLKTPFGSLTRPYSGRGRVEGMP